MRFAVIMAGGSGTRLWPLSRQGQPKQLLPLFEGRSLLQAAWDRLIRLLPAESIWVCTGAAYAEEVIAQLPELPVANLLGEPEGRDSLNAVAWSAAVLARRDPEAVVAMVTADQLIEPLEIFLDRLDAGFRLAESDPTALVTFGVVPTHPHTGYGYLERGADIEGYPASQVARFKEKPELATAERYVESGRYWWNAGMFVWRAATLLDQLRVLLPQSYRSIIELAEFPERVGEIYPGLFKTSVDYAIMEPVSQGRTEAHVVAVQLPISWVDVGSYKALREQLAGDEDDNACAGPVVAHDATGNLLLNTRGEGTVLAVTALHGMVVVATPTATLVAPLSASQQVKDLASQVATQLGPQLA